MGRHRAPESEELDFDTSVYKPRESSRLRKAWAEYCQPFYKRYRKFFVAVVSAALTALFAVWGGGITPDEWKFIIISAASAIGVCAVPNAPNTKKVNIK